MASSGLHVRTYVAYLVRIDPHPVLVDLSRVAAAQRRAQNGAASNLRCVA